MEKDDRLKKILSFLKEIDKFKLILRNDLCSDIKKAESDAEHSWHLAMFILLFSKDMPSNLDINKMIKLSLVHDLAEIYAGDTFAFDKKGRETKKVRETEAAIKLFSQLPKDLDDDLMILFNEYEDNKTLESQFVRSFDKLQVNLQNVLSEFKILKDKGITLKELHDYNGPYHNNDLSKRIYDIIFKEVTDKKMFD